MPFDAAAGYGATPQMPRSPVYRRSDAIPAATAFGGYGAGVPSLAAHAMPAPQYGGAPHLGQGVYGAPAAAVAAPPANPYAAAAPAAAAPPAAPQNPYATSAPVTGSGQVTTDLATLQAMNPGKKIWGDPIGGYWYMTSFGPMRLKNPGTVAAPEGAHPQYLQDLQDVLSAQENKQVRQAALSSDIYGQGDPLAATYGRLNAEQSARERYPEIMANAVAAHHQMKDQQAWQLYMARLQNQWAQANRPKHNYWSDILGLGGTALGALFGGPAGAALGSQIGGAAGGAANAGYGGTDYSAPYA